MERKLLIEKNINSVNEMIEMGEEFGKSTVPCVVLMYGEAGAGKTHFIKGVAKSFGITEEIISPTYSLRIEYSGKYHLIHIDAYRLESVEEAYESGVMESLDEDNTFTFIEWAKLIEEEINYPHIEIQIDYLSATNRKVSIFKVE